ncbi:MAG: hypothetical protein JWM76_1576 [Pseudonocardiales bacterium]|nr:hypothetical protein [Pseudonocardiales bacterium]
MPDPANLGNSILFDPVVYLREALLRMTKLCEGLLAAAEPIEAGNLSRDTASATVRPYPPIGSTEIPTPQIGPTLGA